MVVERTRVSNNGLVNLFKNLEIPVVGVFIEDIIGSKSVLSYLNPFSE